MKSKLAVLLLIISILFTGCGETSLPAISLPLSQTEEAPEEETALLYVGEHALKPYAAAVFISSRINNYDKIYGDDIWSVALSEGSFLDVVTDKTRTLTALFFVASCMADSDGITLSDEEIAAARKAGAAYYGAISESDRTAYSLEETDIIEMFSSCRKAEKEYAAICSSEAAEVSQDESRVIELKRISVSFRNLTEVEKVEKKEVIMNALARIEAGEDFDTVATDSGSSADSFLAARGELSEEEEEAAFALATGEVSGLLDLYDSIVILKCVNSYVEDESALHRSELLREREEEAFLESLESYLELNPLHWNSALWEETSQGGFTETSADFFEIYKNYFGEM